MNSNSNNNNNTNNNIKSSQPSMVQIANYECKLFICLGELQIIYIYI